MRMRAQVSPGFIKWNFLAYTGITDTGTITHHNIVNYKEVIMVEKHCVSFWNVFLTHVIFLVTIHCFARPVP